MSWPALVEFLAEEQNCSGAGVMALELGEKGVGWVVGYLRKAGPGDLHLEMNAIQT